MLPRIVIDKEKCKGLACVKCLAICPTRVLVVTIKGPIPKSTMRRPEDFTIMENRPHRCIGCMDCVKVCPENCIQVFLDGGKA